MIWIACKDISDKDHITAESLVPSHVSTFKVPEDNPLTEAKINLGKRLFNDPSLSLDSTISCASCHKVDLAFADSLSITPGIHGNLGDRNPPSLLNAAYLTRINKDGGVAKLDIQALVPIEDENEMGISIITLIDRLQANPVYNQLFSSAYGSNVNGYNLPRALASYVRTLTSFDSPYDNYIKGDLTALSSSALRGRALFFSERLNCASCHSGELLTNQSFENNGLYVDYPDLGRALITLNTTDIGKFRVPSLRNVALTAPYMFDGSLYSLEEVLDHYQHNLSGHANQSQLLKSFELNDSEVQNLIAFLESLTGEKARRGAY